MFLHVPYEPIHGNVCTAEAERYSILWMLLFGENKTNSKVGVGYNINQTRRSYKCDSGGVKKTHGVYAELMCVLRASIVI